MLFISLFLTCCTFSNFQFSDDSTSEQLEDAAAAQDAVEEEEDPLNLAMLQEDSPADAAENAEAALPNNDFCFSEEDFLETRRMMNDATRHRGTFLNAWDTIKALVGTTVEITSQQGPLLWTVVDKVDEDELKAVREEELNFFQNHKGFHTCLQEGDTRFSSTSYADGFWTLWPTDIESEVEKLNNIIERDNIKRKENYQRPIKKVQKSEYIMFHALTIAASAYAGQGETLWLQEYYKNKTKRIKRGLSETVDFGEYLKLWRFDQIKMYIAEVMEDASLKDNDDWWRFKSRIDLVNRKRINTLMTSHILVFDESMSAFVPR